MKKKKPFEIRLIFDDLESAKSFVASWLDGGLDGGGNLDWDTVWEESDDWTKGTPKWLRIKGNGESLNY